MPYTAATSAANPPAPATSSAPIVGVIVGTVTPVAELNATVPAKVGVVEQLFEMEQSTSIVLLPNVTNPNMSGPMDFPVPESKISSSDT